MRVLSDWVEGDTLDTVWVLSSEGYARFHVICPVLWWWIGGGSLGGLRRRQGWPLSGDDGGRLVTSASG